VRTLNRLIAVTFAGAALACAGCSASHSSQPLGAPQMLADAGGGFGDVKSAIAIIHPTEGHKATGTVLFTQEADGVKVVAHLTGLAPGKHGFHIHEYGDCSDMAKADSAGGHYDPEGTHHHALPEKGGAHHAGDMGNISANGRGEATLETTLTGVTIAGDKDPILGRSVIVHEKPDTGAQPTGDAGGRLGCGVIGVANPKTK